VTIALTTAAILLAALALAWLHYWFWTRRFTDPLEYELDERVPTPDGCAIEIRRLPRAKDTHGVPVLLVHGLALNHRNHDMKSDLSLARYLAEEGRDVWLLTLRSGRPDLTWSEERCASFAHMTRYDVPTGVDEVLRRTGAPELDYVGFSMGGMLLYASIGRTLDPAKLRKVAIVGSPGRIFMPLAVLATAARYVPGWIVPTLRLRLVSRMFAFAIDWVTTPIHTWVYNPKNVDRGAAAYALVNGFQNIPATLAVEFVRWAANDGVVTLDGERVDEGLAKIDRPVIFIAGAADQLAPPRAVAHAFEAWGAAVPSVVKSMRIAGVEQGAVADYGHGDLAIGRYAAEDVFEPVARFLET
jgi:polyhydroxyalkanoate synthase